MYAHAHSIWRHMGLQLQSGTTAMDWLDAGAAVEVGQILHVILGLLQLSEDSRWISGLVLDCLVGGNRRLRNGCPHICSSKSKNEGCPLDQLQSKD